MCYETLLREFLYRLEVSCTFHYYHITVIKQFFKPFTCDAVNSFEKVVVLLYLVELESSRRGIEWSSFASMRTVYLFLRA